MGSKRHPEEGSRSRPILIRPSQMRSKPLHARAYYSGTNETEGTIQWRRRRCEFCGGLTLIIRTNGNRIDRVNRTARDFFQDEALFTAVTDRLGVFQVKLDEILAVD